MIIQYDGSQYFGWQLQKDIRTVQGDIEQALKKIYNSNDRIKLYGSGRTDTGVHALAQVAHVDLNSKKLKEKEIKHALNANLPLDCRILEVRKVAKNFHARFDAKRRYYRYQCYIGDSILYSNQCWILSELNCDYLNMLAKKIKGVHNFLSFCKYREDIKSTECIIYHSKWSIEKEMIIFTISANRFLHHMIRYLVGTMVAVSENRMSEQEFDSLLRNPMKNVKIFKAPPQGLILENICYV